MANNQLSYTVSANIPQFGSGPHGPFLIPPNFPASPFTINIPNVANAKDSPTTCGITNAMNADFSLSWGSVGNPQNVYAKVTVQTTNMVTYDPVKRALLKQNFALLRQQLEALESTGCLSAGLSTIIAQRVASMLLLRLDEILYYYYGFDPSYGIELSPGMLLQVESGAFQYVAPYASNLPGAMGDAFVSSGQTTYAVSLNNQNQKISFQSYLANLSPFSIAPPGASAANIIDLTASGTTRRHWRLVYPAQFISTSNITLDPQLQYNVALLGADTLVDLTNAASTYVNSNTCAVATPPNAPILCTYFSGRSSVTPQIPLILQNTSQYMSVGTTLRNLLQNYMLQSSADLASFVGNLNLFRYASSGLGLAPLKPLSIPITINTSFLDPVFETGLTVWDLPLVTRDEISWTWNQLS